MSLPPQPALEAAEILQATAGTGPCAHPVHATVGTGYCKGCQRRWSSLAEAHCSRCHHSFTSTGNFDRHVGSKDCSMEKRDGTALFVPLTRANGAVVYAAAGGTRPAHWDAS